MKITIKHSIFLLTVSLVKKVWPAAVISADEELQLTANSVDGGSQSVWNDQTEHWNRSYVLLISHFCCGIPVELRFKGTTTDVSLCNRRVWKKPSSVKLSADITPHNVGRPSKWGGNKHDDAFQRQSKHFLFHGDSLRGSVIPEIWLTANNVWLLSATQTSLVPCSVISVPLVWQAPSQQDIYEWEKWEHSKHATERQAQIRLQQRCWMFEANLDDYQISNWRLFKHYVW